MILLLALLGCQEPFGDYKTRITDDRIPTVTLDERNPIELQVHALLSVDGALYTDTQPQFTWGWISRERDAHKPLDTLDDFYWVWASDSPSPTISVVDQPWNSGDRGNVALLLLVVTFPSGIEKRALVPLGPGATPGTIELNAATGQTTAGTPLTVFDQQADADTWDHAWLATGGRFLSTDETGTTAEWYPGELVQDEDEPTLWEPTDPLPEGTWSSLVGIRLSTGSAAAAGVVDVHVGEISSQGAWVNGRWLDGALPGLQQIRLVGSDAFPLGLVGEDPEPLTPLQANQFPLPSCAGSGTGTFDPIHLVRTTCTRPDLDGLTVAVLGTESP